MSAPNEQWSRRYGFVLATIDGAVGLGNIWRFTYVASENGGAAFLFIYLTFLFLIGVLLMIAEFAIGRRAQGAAISAFETAGTSSRWRSIHQPKLAFKFQTNHKEKQHHQTIVDPVVNGHFQLPFAKANTGTSMHKIIIGLCQGAIGQDQGNDRIHHQK